MKPIYTSKTVWLGLLIALIPFFETLNTLPLTASQAQVVSGVLGVLVMINRFYTVGVVGINKNSDK
jgi:hypothetical protein